MKSSIPESQIKLLNIDKNTALSTQIALVHPRKRRVWLALLLLPWLLGSGLFVWQRLTPQREFASAPASPASSATRPALPPQPVETINLTAKEAIRQVELIGGVEATKQTMVRTLTRGIVQQIAVEVGDAVSQSTVIAKLSDADQQLAVAEAQARLASAQSDLARIKSGTRPEVIEQRRVLLQAAQSREQVALDNLRRMQALAQEGGIAEQELIQARADVEDAKGNRLEAQAVLADALSGSTAEEISAQQGLVAAAQAVLNQAKLDLQRTQIRSLTAGVVASKAVNVGDFVTNGEPILTLVDKAELDVFLELPEELTGQVQPGLAVSLTTRSLPGWQGEAIISGLVPTADATSRRQRIRVRLDQPPQGLLPGAAVQAKLRLPIRDAHFVVPRDALVQQGGQWFIFTVAAGVAHQHEVQLVSDGGLEVAIASDQLQLGQAIVVTGGDTLIEGAPVRSVNQSGEGEQAS
ncbi:MAG: efflux RND transporter periplasmic adaptor subunit [Cyanothece sp. SIO1E1]|nr:efflux RND transporter periplasmic adaptor subunit [Cyanothece sp. SIO1E1]